MTIENTLPVNNDAAITGKLVLLIIILTVATPMVAAYWIFQSGLGIPSSTINKGSLLIPATTTTELSLSDLDNQLLPWQQQNYWRMLTVVEDECHQSCRDYLYTARQVHIRLAKEAHRIQRYLFFIGDTPPSDSVPLEALEDSGLQIVRASKEQWQATFASASLVPDNHIVLVDQNGYAMMTYDQNNTGTDLLDDLTRLLKYSYE